jgi:hypothetical protein
MQYMVERRKTDNEHKQVTEHEDDPQCLQDNEPQSA